MPHPAACLGAVFFILPIPSEFGGPGRGQFCLLRVRKNREVPEFKRFLRDLSVSLPSFDLFACQPPPLSGRQGYRRSESKPLKTESL
jgi:hypothetical protein